MARKRFPIIRKVRTALDRRELSLERAAARADIKIYAKERLKEAFRQRTTPFGRKRAPFGRRKKRQRPGGEFQPSSLSEDVEFDFNFFDDVF